MNRIDCDMMIQNDWVTIAVHKNNDRVEGTF